MTFKVIEEIEENHIKDLHLIYQLEWWTEGRQLEDIKKMLQNTDVIVAFCDSKTKKLFAFARVITDYVYKALILDVIVERSYRKKDLGKTLMESILNHNSLKSVNHFELYCLPEMVSFYKKFGFSEKLNSLVFMRLTKI